MDYGTFFLKWRDGEPLTAGDLADAIESLLGTFDRTIQRLEQRRKRNPNMGAFDETTDTIEVHNPKWDAHESVTIRYIPTAEDEAWVNNQLVKYMSESGSGKGNKGKMMMENHTGEARLLWLQRMIVSWTFTRNGQPVSLSHKAIRAMKLSYSDYIYEEMMRHQEPFELSEEEEEDFTSGASESTDEAPEAEVVETVKGQSRNHLSPLKS